MKQQSGSSREGLQRACGRRRLAPLGLMLVGLAACDGLLDVELPGALGEADVFQPSVVPILVNSVQADFECAFGNHAQFAGAFTDEWASSASFPSPESIDRRENRMPRDLGGTACTTAVGASQSSYYTPLQVARVQAAQSYNYISGLPDDQITGGAATKERHLATIGNYMGYTLTMLVEGFCEMAIDGGPSIEPDAVLAMAEQWFTDAIGHGAAIANEDLVNWGSVGRARVRMRLGNHAGALSDAQRVPEGFRKNATFDNNSSRRRNPHFDRSVESGFWTLDHSLRNLEIDGVPDNRVVGIDMGRAGHDPRAPLWSVNKYASPEAPIPLATWEEAQLIIAEIQRGQAAVDAINRLRVAAQLPTFSSTDPAEIWAEILEERRRVLFGQSHRIGDMIHYDEIEWRTGVRADKGDFYADEFRCLPLPETETATNPNFS